MSQPPSERQLRMSTTRLQLFWNHVIVIFRQRRRIRTTRQHADASANDKLARQLFAYEMLATRRNQQDSMLWQVPALALTAQAFLLTIALGGDAIPAFSRALAAGLGLVVACMTMQLMAKHRHLTELDNAWLALMEREIGIAPIAARDILTRSVRSTTAAHVRQYGRYTSPPRDQEAARPSAEAAGPSNSAVRT